MKHNGLLFILWGIGIAASAGETPLPAAATSGVIVARHEYDAADLSAAPQAQTVGEYFQRFPASTPYRLSPLPLLHMAEFTVKTDDGREVHVHQETQPELRVGARVSLGTEDGKPALTVLP